MTSKQRMIGIGAIAGIAALVAAQIIGTFLTRDRTPLSRFTTDVGGFSVMLPTGVSNETDVVETKLGELEYVMYKARSKYSQFLIAYTDYPPDYIDDSNPADLLVGAAKGAAANINGKLTKEESFLHNDIAVREVHVKGPNRVHMRCRVMLVGNRLYQVMALSNRRHVGDSKVDEVLESFQLTGTPDHAAAVPPPAGEDTDSAEAPAP